MQLFHNSKISQPKFYSNPASLEYCRTVHSLAVLHHVLVPIHDTADTGEVNHDVVSQVPGLAGRGKPGESRIRSLSG